MKNSVLIVLCFCPIVILGQHRSILITDKKGVCEPSIKVNPNNTDEIVAGIVLDHIARSVDGGETWQLDKLTSPYGVWGDPVIDVDTAGSFYYYHLSNPPDGDWIDRIVCQRSDDGGETWTKGTYTGLNGSKDQDKHWSIVDPYTNDSYLTWTEFDKYGSKDSTCMSRIRFSKSTDKALTWTTPKTISQQSGDCIDDDDTVEGAVPALGPQGEIFVSWAGPRGIVFSRSTDKGENWSDEVLVDSMPNGWNFHIPGIYRANGLPITKCDLSEGEHHGRIYINWCDQRSGENDTDVWLKYSDDQGRTWSEALKVNQAKPESHQFFTWMDVDQATGELYFVYYDRSRSSDNPWSTEVYMAFSADGGATFIEFPVEAADRAFVPNPEVFFGDYNNISVYDGIARPIWTRLENGQLSVWTSILDMNELRTGIFRIRPELPSGYEGEYCLELFSGKKRKKVLSKKKFQKGDSSFTYIWDANKYPKGVYEIKLMIDRKKVWSKEINWDGETER
ncbi:MAG: exo-alpha-sialidase [Flavobacteriales bacterium]|nr:exo-alpha-sialidase [Flavobacteriales bacterium]